MMLRYTATLAFVAIGFWAIIAVCRAPGLDRKARSLNLAFMLSICALAGGFLIIVPTRFFALAVLSLCTIGSVGCVVGSVALFQRKKRKSN